jgi:hypothetical protein
MPFLAGEGDMDTQRGQEHSVTESTPATLDDPAQAIVETRGNTQIGTLRKIYGPQFAPGSNDAMSLSEAAATLDPVSLDQICGHHRDGSLPRRIAVASTFIDG